MPSAKMDKTDELRKSLLESVSNAVWALDMEGKVTFVNPAAARMLGYTTEELIGKHMHDTVHHSYPDGTRYPSEKCPMHATLVDGKPRACLDELLWRKDGSRCTVEYSAYPLFSHDRQIGAAVVFQDISERKHAEEALRDSEHRFRTIVQSNPIPIIITRLADGCMIEVNEATLRLFGYTREEMVGHTSLELGMWFHPEERARLRALFSESGSVADFDLEYRHKSGKTGIARMSAQRITLNGEPCFLGIGEDITAQKHAEDRLRESNEKLRGLFELSPLGITLTDMQGHYVEFNEAFRQICGYSGEELKQLDSRELTPDEYAEQEAHQLDCLEQTGRYGPYEKEYLRKDGSRVPLELNGMLITGTDGQRYIWSIVEDISERKRAEQRMQEDQARLSGLVESAMDAIVSTDENQNIILFSQGAEHLFGYRAADIIGQPLEKLIPQRFHATHRQYVEEFGRTGITTRSLDMLGKSYGLRASGEEFPFEATISKVEVAGKKIYTVILRDITKRKQYEEAVKLAESVYQKSHEGIVVTDENNLIVEVNPAFTELTGYTPDEVRGKNPRMFRSGKHDAQFYREMWQSIVRDGYWQGEIWDHRKDGELHAKWLSISAIRHADGSIFRHVGQFSDITEKKRKDELIWTQANYDVLTNLPNRRLLSDRIRQSMTSGARSGRHGALVSLDLDQFKQLNDTLGHGMGDKLLIEVARRLQACVREEDTVARMGGDEFMVVLNELSSNQDEAAIQAEQIAEKIRNELCRPYQLGDTEHHSSPSVGIVIFRGHLDEQELLLAHVDAAMYQAKAKGRNNICFFDLTMQAALEKRSLLESALRVALQHDEFKLYYQLQVDSAGHAVGAEALLRWFHPALGMISPAQFIPVAEETGLILPVGDWVLETACAQLALWQADSKLNHLTIAVNVSARQFRDAGFVGKVLGALKKSGVKPEALKLELTESLVLDNVEESIGKMRELKMLGVRFSVDDFGTGYSSLSYLSRLPIDQLKIDQAFVRDITTDRHDAAIVQTIISMAHSLGLEVIAEGVETPEQREFLELRGCLAYQGYLYARPVPVDQLDIKLANLRAS
ncbi:MAG: PAS domain S-box protein [Nitrosomonadales bacterium]|nr:PAS domain S-box protein [Nitrosomonadales bacterium]